MNQIVVAKDSELRKMASLEEENSERFDKCEQKLQQQIKELKAKIAAEEAHDEI